MSDDTTYSTTTDDDEDPRYAPAPRIVTSTPESEVRDPFDAEPPPGLLGVEWAKQLWADMQAAIKRRDAQHRDLSNQVKTLSDDVSRTQGALVRDLRRMESTVGGLSNTLYEFKGATEKTLASIATRVGASERTLADHAKRLGAQATLIVFGSALGSAAWAWIKQKYGLN